MSTRIELHNELMIFYKNVYFQPPSNIRMIYPCIVYNKTRALTEAADDDVYQYRQGYSVTVIEKNPDSDVAEKLNKHFRYSSIGTYLTIDNLHQTTLNIYY